MEELVTIDGKQFQLTYDQPISPDQRLQVIEDIKKSIGCKICGQTSSQIRKLAGACAATPKGSGESISLNAAPMSGVAPYTVTFYKKVGPNAPVQIGTQSGVAEATSPTVGTLNPVLSYALTDEDVAGSTGDTTTLSPTNPDAVILDPGKIRIRTVVTDSCLGTGGPASCEDFCDISLICIAPTCNPIIGV